MKMKRLVYFFALIALFGCERNMVLTDNYFELEVDEFYPDTKKIIEELALTEFELRLEENAINVLKAVYMKNNKVYLYFNNAPTIMATYEQDIEYTTESTILFRMDNEHIRTLRFSKVGDDLRVILRSHTKDDQYLPFSYIVVNSKQQNEPPVFSNKTYEEITDYINRGEVRGNVKYVKEKRFYIREEFSEHILVPISEKIQYYDNNINLTKVEFFKPPTTYYTDPTYSTNYEKKKLEKASETTYTYHKNLLIKREINNLHNDPKKIITHYSYNNKLTQFDEVVHDPRYYTKPRLYRVEYSYEKDSILIELNEFADNKLEKKLKYNYSDNEIIVSHYYSDGREFGKTFYKKNGELKKGRITLWDKVSYNPHEHFHFGTSLLDIEVVHINDNTSIIKKYSYPPEHLHATYLKNSIFNQNCDIIKHIYQNRGRRYSGGFEFETGTDIYKYLHDSNNNWIRRIEYFQSSGITNKPSDDLRHKLTYYTEREIIYYE